MTTESRGKILGEKPLESSSKNKDFDAYVDIHLQFNLSDTFTKPASLSEIPDVTKPFREDPTKQARFEQFLKDKYRGGLRTKDSYGANNMSEAARAHERLQFEAVAEAIGKGKCGKENNFSNQQSPYTGLQFTSGGLEVV